jgi:hypothetical protein
MTTENNMSEDGAIMPNESERTLEQFTDKVADQVRARLEKHGHLTLALYAVSRQGREHYQEFPVDVGANRNEIAQKMRGWIERKHIVRYAFVAEAWQGEGNDDVAPSQQLNKKEIVHMEAQDKTNRFKYRRGVAPITRPDDVRKPVLGEFDWSCPKDVGGRFSHLFLPLLPPSEYPGELAGRMKWLVWNEHTARVVSACLLVIMREVWNDIEGDTVEDKKALLIDVVTKVLSVNIAEAYESPEKAQQMLDDILKKKKPEVTPLERLPIFPLAVPGYATKRARNVVGHLLRILEGEMAAQNTEELTDNILAGLVTTAGQIARVSNTQERNRLIAGVQDLVEPTVKGTLWAVANTQGMTVEDLQNITEPGEEIEPLESAKLN